MAKLLLYENVLEHAYPIQKLNNSTNRTAADIRRRLKTSSRLGLPFTEAKPILSSIQIPTLIVDSSHTSEAFLSGHIPQMQVDEDILFEANHFGEKVHTDLRWEEEGKSS